MKHSDTHLVEGNYCWTCQKWLWEVMSIKSWQQLTLPLEVIDIEEDEESEVDSEKHKG